MQNEGLLDFNSIETDRITFKLHWVKETMQEMVDCVALMISYNQNGLNHNLATTKDISTKRLV